MKTFLYEQTRAMSDAVAAAADGRRLLAGGTDLLPLLKSGLQEAHHLVDIKTSDLPATIEPDDGGLRLGTLVTLTDLAEAEVLQRQPWWLLGEAARTAATRQLRNRATLGGNLLQRPRCWYFRSPDTHCWLEGGDTCLARDGCNEHHAVYGTSTCRAAHPSDLAGCLLALDASVVLERPGASREVPLHEFFAEPSEERRHETVIEPGEVIIEVRIDPPPANAISTYLKAMDRKVWAFALAGIAVVMARDDDGKVTHSRIVANGMAPIPWRLEACERALQGTSADNDAIEAAVSAVAEGAKPLSDNAWKLDLTRRLLRRALTTP